MNKSVYFEQYGYLLVGTTVAPLLLTRSKWENTSRSGLYVKKKNHLQITITRVVEIAQAGN